MCKPLYGLVFGYKTNPLERRKNGKLLLFDTEQKAQEWGKDAQVNFHVVPVDLETALRKDVEVSALANLQLAGAVEHCASAIGEMTESISRIEESLADAAQAVVLRLEEMEEVGGGEDEPK